MSCDISPLSDETKHCSGRSVISQDIEDTVNPRRVTVFLVLGRVAGR
jgi:hypothetical protein